MSAERGPAPAAARWKRPLAVAGGLAIALLFAYSAMTAKGPRPLVVAAMPPGSSWYVFAATLSQLLEPRLPEGRAVEVFARGGGTGNPTLVEQGKVDIAISQVATALWAWEGQQIAYHGVEHRRIRALVGGLNRVWITVVAREDYLRSSGHETLESILRAEPAPRIILKPPGSTTPVAMDMILEFYGLRRADIENRGGQIIQIGVSQIPDMLADGRADLYFETAIKGHPGLTETTTLTSIRFLDFAPDLLNYLSRQGMRPLPLPAWFRGQTAPAESVDCGTVLITRDDFPEDLAYLITKTICENREAMVQAHRAWADFDPARGGLKESTGIPLHPGAERYFKERGWL